LLTACDEDGLFLGRGASRPVGITKFEQLGPQPVRILRSGRCTLFLSSTAGDPKPGLGWANGTGASPSTYAGLLTRIASFGVQVTAANSPQAGDGTDLSDCIDQLASGGFNVQDRFCAAGHSQGGSGAVNASRINERVVCTIAVQPDNRFTARSDGRDMVGPALVLCGSDDRLAPCGASRSRANGSGLFNQANVPVTQLSVKGATHTGVGSPTGNGGLYAALVAAYTQAVLYADPDARAALFGPSPAAASDSRVESVRSKGF